MSSANANDGVAAGALAAAQNHEFHAPTQTRRLILSEHTHTHTHTQKKNPECCSRGQLKAFKFIDANRTHHYTHMQENKKGAKDAHTDSPGPTASV